MPMGLNRRNQEEKGLTDGTLEWIADLSESSALPGLIYE